MNRPILISGGIGAGKSVVCRVLEAMGYPVYDCDSRAKALMDTDIELCRNLDRALSPFCSASLIDTECRLDRAALASVVFSNPEALKILNANVHPAVLRDIDRWRGQYSGLVFVESAIPAESGLRDMVIEEWIVEAPESLRIERVIARNGLSAEQVKNRIKAQRSEWLHPHPQSFRILNDGEHSVLCRLNELIQQN